MSESLRDQLLKAGFSQPKQDTKEKKSKKQSNAKRKANDGPSVPKANRQSSNKKSGQSKRYKAAPVRHAEHHAPPGPRNKTRKAPAIKPRTGSWSTRTPTPINDDKHTDRGASAEITETRSNPESMIGKDSIEKLINENALKSHKGEQIYRFTLNNRIRECHTNEETRKKLADSSFGIAILDNMFFVVPASIVKKIISINAQWEVFLAGDADSQDEGKSSDDNPQGYDNYQVPDDLMW